MRWVVGGIGAVVAVLAIAWVLFVPAADWLATHDVGPATGPARAARLQAARDAARGRLLTLGAGLFAISALVYTARSFTLSREGQVTDRYTKAIEQLGSDKLNVRIGGIYALERIARDSARDHPTVMEVLAAFVREHSREQWPPMPDEPGVDAPERTTRSDVQAAVTVIGRRNFRHDRQAVNLNDANLVRADLTGGTLIRATLRDVNLTRADLTFTGANLIRANLTGATLTGADLTGADLTRATLVGANLTRANLTGATLTDADLTGVTLIRANLTRANLTRANLRQANLTDADLTGADLTRATLTRATLTGWKHTGATLTDADLTGATLFSADYAGAILAMNLFEDAPVPKGWVRDPRSGQLKRAIADGDDSGN